MSAPSGPPLKVFVCPRCGEQIELPPGPKGHYCPEVYVEGEGRHFVKAEEVEVIPVAELASLRSGLAKEIAHLNEEIAGRPRKTRVRRATRFLERLMEHPALTDWASKEER